MRRSETVHDVIRNLARLFVLAPSSWWFWLLPSMTVVMSRSGTEDIHWSVESVEHNNPTEEPSKMRVMENLKNYLV
jgi:hypothetical protein